MCLKLSFVIFLVSFQANSFVVQNLQDPTPCVLDSDCGDFLNCHHSLNVSSGTFAGECICDSNYFLNIENGTCEPKAKYGEFCDSISKPCQDLNPLMQCIDSSCQCSNSGHVYDTVKGRCAIKVGDLCYQYRSLIYSICVSNSYCRAVLPYKKGMRCVCTNGFKPINGSCLANFGTHCNESIPCNSQAGLVCSNGECMCNSPLYDIYDVEIGACRRAHESTCITNDDCISHGKCDQSFCICSDGYTSARRGVCKLDYGQPCKSSCNEDRGLVCKHSICQCYDPSLNYNNETRSCVNRLGGICGEVENGNGVFESEYTTRKITTINCESKNTHSNNIICAKRHSSSACTCMAIESLKDEVLSRLSVCFRSKMEVNEN